MPITGDVLITEVHKNSGASPIGSYEWVEIQNLNGTVINLQNWEIGTVDTTDVFVSNHVTLLDGECAIIHFTTVDTPDDDDDSTGRSNSGYGAVWDFYVANSDVFDDTQDQVVLKNSGSAYGDAMVYWDNETDWSSVDPQTLVDASEWDSSGTSTAVNLGSDSTIRMMMRTDYGDNNDKSDWSVFSAWGGNGATPGMENTGYRSPIILITEADPRGLNSAIGHPWFELQNVSGSSLSINLNGWITNSLDYDDLTLSSNAVTLADGRMALVHFAAGLSENNSTGWSYSTSPGARFNCWDLYLGDAAGTKLYIPQDEIVLFNFIGTNYEESGPEDAVVYWDGECKPSGIDPQRLIGWSQWTTDSSTGDMVNYGTSANGFQRQTSGDTNAKGDWTVMSANSLNPGLQNMGYYQPTLTPVGYKTPTPSPIPSPSPTPTAVVWALQTTLTDASGPILSVFADSYYLFALTADDLYVWDYSSWDLLTTLTDPSSATTGSVYADSYYLYAGAGNWLHRWKNDGSFGGSGSSDEGKAINSIYGDGADYLFAAYEDGNTERFDRADFNTSTVLSDSGSNRYDVFVDSYYVYAADGNKQIYAWETDTDNSFVAAFSPQSASNWATESKAFTAVHADSYYLFAGNANDNLYEFEPGAYWNGTTDYKTRKDFATETITAVFADPTGRYYYASSEDNNVYVYKTNWWDAQTTLTDGADAMNDVYADTEYIFGGCADNKVYIWLAKHTPSPTPTPSSIPLPSPTPTAAPNLSLVINEVAWMGTSHSAYDEWIELFNPSAVTDVNIENWSIYGADTGECLNFASYDGFTTFTVPAEGYAVYANDPWVFWTGAAESIWDATISLLNTGDRIILYDQPNCSAGAGVVVDSVDNNNGSWFAGKWAPLRKTMERINPGAYGTIAANWGDWNGGTAFATDSSGWEILGSPGAENSIYSTAPTVTPTPTPTVTPTPTPVAYKTVTPTPTPVGYQTPSPSPSPNVYQDVVFNELAWMGTKYGGHDDEWIELYVNNGSELDLLGWTITAHDGVPNFTIWTTVKVDTGDYVLLERYVDNVVSDIAADFVYHYYDSWLENNGEELWLKNASGEVVDHIDMADYWWAGNVSTGYTMERVRPDWPSDKRYNWATWNESTQNGKDSTGEDLPATAKSRNSVWNASTSTPAVTPTAVNYLDICFNEIAWMGTNAAPTHEWIEFRNNTASAINMKGFRVYSRSGNIDFTVASDVNITAGGYYIFERETDYVIRDVTGYIYNSWYLSNSGEWLILEGSDGTVWDDINYDENWPAGTNDPYRYTMEKINPQTDGNVAANWANNNGVTTVGLDADDDPILGTANAQNSVYYCVGCRRAPQVPAAGILQPGLYSKDRYYPAPTPGGDVPTPLPAPEEADFVRVEPGDYDGDGTVDVAIFRSAPFDGGPATSLWIIRDLSRFYFGESSDLPVSGDYDGDDSTDVAVYRSGLWAIKDLSRAYLGTGSDVPVPGDYDGDGICDLAVFRPASGLWVAPGIIRAYFGGENDIPIPGDYNGDGSADIAIFRSSTGLWEIKDITLFYFGAEGDVAVPGDYDGSGLWTAGIFRPAPFDGGPASGLWAIRGITMLYFGTPEDQPVPGDYNGDLADEPAIFRKSSGLWAVEGVTRVYLGP